MDEAHRSHYVNLAINLGRALPHALKIGFTGTPIETDKSTRYVFGEVLHEYKIKDAVRDRAVKQIICESRQTELHLQNKIIGEDFDKLVLN